MIRRRPAPSAARIVSSPRRCAPRASSRLVTFTQAIASKRSTAPITATSAGFTPLVTSSCSELTRNPRGKATHGARTNDGTGTFAIASSSRAAPARSRERRPADQPRPSARAISIRCTSVVPSPISRILASR